MRIALAQMAVAPDRRANLERMAGAIQFWLGLPLLGGDRHAVRQHVR